MKHLHRPTASELQSILGLKLPDSAPSTVRPKKFTKSWLDSVKLPANLMMESSSGDPCATGPWGCLGIEIQHRLNKGNKGPGGFSGIGAAHLYTGIYMQNASPKGGSSCNYCDGDEGTNRAVRNCPTGCAPSIVLKVNYSGAVISDSYTDPWYNGSIWKDAGTSYQSIDGSCQFEIKLNSSCQFVGPTVISGSRSNLKGGGYVSLDAHFDPSSGVIYFEVTNSITDNLGHVYSFTTALNPCATISVCCC